MSYACQNVRISLLLHLLLHLATTFLRDETDKFTEDAAVKKITSRYLNCAI